MTFPSSAARAMWLGIGLLSACGASSAAPSPTPTGASVGSATGALTVDPADLSCTVDADCTAILTQCSACEGACTGVRVDRAAQYDGKLDCRDYHGAVCNYDCRPSFHIEAPRCRSGRCESVRN